MKISPNGKSPMVKACDRASVRFLFLVFESYKLSEDGQHAMMLDHNATNHHLLGPPHQAGSHPACVVVGREIYQFREKSAWIQTKPSLMILQNLNRRVKTFPVNIVRTGTRF